MKGIDKIVGPLAGRAWCCQNIVAVEIGEGVNWNNGDEGCGVSHLLLRSRKCY